MNWGAIIFGAVVGYLVWDSKGSQAARRRGMATERLLPGHGAFIGPVAPEEVEDYDIALDEAETFLHDAKAMLEAGDLEEARYYARKAVETSEEALDAAYELGDAGRFAKAERVISEAMSTSSAAVTMFWAEARP